MNLDCLSNDILSNRNVQQAKFIIKLKLNVLSYEIEKRKVSRKELDEIVQHFINTQKDKIAEFKSRYKKIKKLGKKILRKYKRSKIRSVEKDVKVSRNAPCPCGSGKKYKNCCGR